MELRQLSYFVAVAEEASFTRGADRVHVSQSGVSAQIARLERELGTALLDRSGRAVRTTAAGDAALVHARAALGAAGALRSAVDEVRDVVSGRVALGMVTACTVAPLFAALASFHAEHPGVEIDVQEDESDRLIASVVSSSLDVALVGTAGAPPAELSSSVVISEGLVALVPPVHALASRRRVGLAAVCEHPLICLPRGTGIRTVLDQEVAAAGLRADVALQASAPDAIADLAARGMGVAVLSASMAPAWEDRLRAVPISGLGTPAVLSLVWSKSPSPAAKELVRCCREAFGSSPPPAATE